MANGILPIIGMFAYHEKFCGNVHKISPIGTMFAKKAFNYHPAFPKGQGRIANYTGVINNWKDEFYGCYEYGLCYVLQLDPAAIGAPGRIGLLEELLDYIDEFDSVWWTSGEEMYQYYQNK